MGENGADLSIIANEQNLSYQRENELLVVLNSSW